MACFKEFMTFLGLICTIFSNKANFFQLRPTHLWIKQELFYMVKLRIWHWFGVYAPSRICVIRK